MTAETLSATAGILLSLAAAYIPPFAPWFNRLDGTRKRLVMLALLVLAALGSFLVECSVRMAGAAAATAFNDCTATNALPAMRVFIAALVANQAAFQIGVRRTEAIPPDDAWMASLDLFEKKTS